MKKLRCSSIIVVAFMSIALFSPILLLGCSGRNADFIFTLNEDGVSYTVSNSRRPILWGTAPRRLPGHLRIPEDHNGLPVTIIGDFSGTGTLRTVTIPASIIEI